MGGWLLGEPAFLCLVEAFNLSLGLWVSGRTVLLFDAEDREKVFEGVSSSCEAGGVDPSVVGEGGSWWAICLDAGEEGRDDVVTCDWLVGGGREKFAGVVIEPVQDLDVAAIG